MQGFSGPDGEGKVRGDGTGEMRGVRLQESLRTQCGAWTLSHRGAVGGFRARWGQYQFVLQQIPLLCVRDGLERIDLEARDQGGSWSIAWTRAGAVDLGRKV